METEEEKIDDESKILEKNMRMHAYTNCTFCNCKWTEEHSVKIGLKYVCKSCLIRLGEMIKFVS